MVTIYVLAHALLFAILVSKGIKVVILVKKLELLKCIFFRFSAILITLFFVVVLLFDSASFSKFVAKFGNTFNKSFEVSFA